MGALSSTMTRLGSPVDFDRSCIRCTRYSTITGASIGSFSARLMSNAASREDCRSRLSWSALKYEPNDSGSTHGATFCRASPVEENAARLITLSERFARDWETTFAEMTGRGATANFAVVGQGGEAG